MKVSKDAVRILREKSGCGIMECKQSLLEAENDMEKAQEILRKKGAAQAIKKGTRTTMDGLVSVRINGEGKSGIMVGVSCETDFVAKTDDFAGMVDEITGKLIASKDVVSVEGIGEDIKTIVTEGIGKLRENIRINKFVRFDVQSSGGLVVSYVHPGSKLGVLLEVKFEKEEFRGNEESLALVKDITMQIAAMSPSWLGSNDIPDEIIQKEKEIYKQQAKDSGKPEKILDQIAAGRLRKFYGQVCLMEQEFIKDSNTTIKKVIADVNTKTGAGLEAVRFERFKIGEE